MVIVRSFYPEQKFGSVTISSDHPNNRILSVDVSVVLVGKLLCRCFVSGFKQNFTRNMYNKPYNSSCIGLGYYSKSCEYLKRVEIERQCIIITHGQEFIVIPIAHEIE